MTRLPRLELADHHSPFDEAVILIDGHDEETIRIECEGALELADRLVRYVNAQEQVIKALTAAAHALRSYEFGNASPVLAHDIAAHCDTVKQQMGAAA
jgi:hypothetical protein